jgi:DNA polymerase III subunit delta
MAEAVPPAQLFLGPEEGEKASALEKLTAALSAAHKEPPEVHRFYAFETRSADVVAVLRNKSLFAHHRLVVLASAEALKRKEDVESLVDYIRSPAPDATLVLVSSELKGEIDRRLLAALPGERTRIFWEMFDSQKKGWIVNFFRQRTITVEAAAVEQLLEMVENNTRDLRAECERLALFLGAGATVDVDSVEQYISHSKEESVFSLFDSVCQRSFPQAVEILARILLSRDAEATQLASGLVWQFRKLFAFKRLTAENYGPAEACAKLNIRSKRSQASYQEGNRRFSAAELENVILVLAEFDSRFRSVKADLHPVLLHLLLYYIVVRGGRGAWLPEG